VLLCGIREICVKADFQNLLNCRLDPAVAMKKGCQATLEQNVARAERFGSVWLELVE
jgi:hypothetical protein